MKKLITLVVILVIILGGWWKYSSYVKGIKQGVQGDPVRTVNSFMNTAVKLSNLFWNEEEREAFRRELEEWKKQAEEGAHDQSAKNGKQPWSACFMLFVTMWTKPLLSPLERWPQKQNGLLHANSFSQSCRMLRWIPSPRQN